MFRSAILEIMKKTGFSFNLILTIQIQVMLCRYQKS